MDIESREMLEISSAVENIANIQKKRKKVSRNISFRRSNSIFKKKMFGSCLDFEIIGSVFGLLLSS